VADFHTETAPDAERHDRQAPPETSRTRPPPTTPTSHTTRSNGGTPNGATPPKIALMTGEDTEAEAKGDYPARRTTTAALSAHTDGKCTSRHRTPRNAASEDRVAPSTRSSRMNAAEFRQLYPSLRAIRFITASAADRVESRTDPLHGTPRRRCGVDETRDWSRRFPTRSTSGSL
jgi:hypothetical protein